MLKGIAVKQRSVLISVSVALCIAISTVILYMVWSSDNLRTFKHGGPLFKTAIGNPKHWTETGMNPKDNSQLTVFGSFHFNNETDKSIKILSIEPTNIPHGLNIERIGILKSGNAVPGIGALNYNSLLEYYSSEKAVVQPPYDIPPSKNDYQVLVFCNAPMDGVYTIQGLLITYEWNGNTYQDYFPDQFDLCNGKACSNIAPPPSHWP